MHKWKAVKLSQHPWPPQRCLSSVLLLLLPLIFPALLLPLPLYHSYFLSFSSFSSPVQPFTSPFLVTLVLSLSSLLSRTLCVLLPLPLRNSSCRSFWQFFLPPLDSDESVTGVTVCIQHQSNSICREHFFFSIVKHVNLVVCFFVIVFFFQSLLEKLISAKILLQTVAEMQTDSAAPLPNALYGQITAQGSCTRQHLVCHQYQRFFKGFFVVVNLN